MFTTFWGIILSLSSVTAFCVSLYIIYKHKDSVKTVSWTIVLLLLPLIGLILYAFFGQTYRKRKMFNRKALRDLKIIDDISKRQSGLLKHDKLFDVNSDLQGYKRAIALLLNNSKSVLTNNNNVELYYKGKDMIEALKKSFREAKETIHIQFYIIEEGVVCNEIRDILVAKAQQGVAVRILYDDFGSWALTKKYVKTFTSAGIEMHAFMKVRFHNLTSRSNFRNHRKIVVVDGKTAFVGGMNIADRYVFGNDMFKHWRDTHMRIEGESVATLQVLFMADWYFASKENIFTNHQKYFPQSTTTEKYDIQIAASGPDSDWASIMQAYFNAISTAKHHIYITTPYFMPTESVLTAIKVAALSGVDVRILLPGKSDSKIVYWATLSYVQELLEAGVKVYLYDKHAFNHAKTLTIDGGFSSVGSVNMDNRSFEFNFEVTAIVYDKQVASSLEFQFRKDCRVSRLVNMRAWEKRSFINNFGCSFARLFSPLL